MEELKKFFVGTIWMFSADFEHMQGVEVVKIKKKSKCFYGILNKAAS